MPRQTVVLTLLFIVNVFSIFQINITAVKDLLKVYGLESISKNLMFSEESLHKSSNNRQYCSCIHSNQLSVIAKVLRKLIFPQHFVSITFCKSFMKSMLQLNVIIPPQTRTMFAN